MLGIAGVRARYGIVPVLRGVDLAVRSGEVRLLIGRNGSGKSTTLKAVAGLVPIEAGSIRLDGVEIGGTSTRRRMMSGIALVPQAGNRGRGIFPHLTVAENLELMAAIRGTEPLGFDTIWAIFPELQGCARKRAANLSGGQQQMLAVGMALMTRPRILLLDEPTCGIARGKALELMRVVRSLALEQGLAILIVEQNVTLVRDYVDAVVALRSGEVVAEVPPQTLDDPSWFSNVL